MLPAHGPENVWWGQIDGSGDECHPTLSLGYVSQIELHAVHGATHPPRMNLNCLVRVRPDEVYPAGRWSRPLTRDTFFVIRPNPLVHIDQLREHIGKMAYDRFKEIWARWRKAIENAKFETRGAPDDDG